MVMSAGRAGLSVRIAALSLAERARGLAAISPSEAAIAPPDLLEGRRNGLGFRQMPRLRLLAGAVGDEALDDAVLERMEGDDGEPAAGLQRPLGGKQRAGELAELVIDEDAQRLEDAGGRVDLVLRIAADMRLDGVGKVERALERALLAPPLDHARDAAGMPLLAEEAEDACEVALLEAVDDVGGAHAGLAPCACRAARRCGRRSRDRAGRAASRRRRCRARRRRPSSSANSSSREKGACTSLSRPANAAARSAPAAIASGSRSIAMTSAPAASSALRIAAGAEGAVDDGLAGAGFERRQQPR